MTAGREELQRISERVRRIEQQVRALRDMHAAEQRETAQRIEAIARVHTDEMELALEELAEVVAELRAGQEAEMGPAASSAGTPDLPAEVDPAAASPKRAKWLAEQERRTHLSRRELLRGRDSGA